MRVELGLLLAEARAEKGQTVYYCSSLLLCQVGKVAQRVVWQRLASIEAWGGNI